MNVAQAPARSRRALRLTSVLFATALVALAATACEPPREPAKNRVVIMVHGYSAFGNGVNCANSFNTLKSSLRSAGFTGPMVTVAFYDSDTGCDVDMRSWDTGLSNSSSWKTIAKAFSKYVHATYTQKGIAVDVVGHSMGGLIIRGAVYGAEKGESGFSPPLLVEDGVTLAGPHDGAAWYSNGCFWGQCSTLKPGSGDLNWLNQNGNPQGAKGTEWTVLGSTNDDVVPDESALFMSVPAARRVKYTNLEHSDYHHNATSVARIAKALSDLGA